MVSSTQNGAFTLRILNAKYKDTLSHIFSKKNRESLNKFSDDSRSSCADISHASSIVLIKLAL